MTKPDDVSQPMKPHSAVSDDMCHHEALQSASDVLRMQQAQPHRSTQHALWEAIKDYLERGGADRLRSHPASNEAGVRVRKLEWSSEPPYSVARVFRGFYSTEWVEEAGVCELRGTFMRGEFPTVAEAKAAAQANYEQRVLSTLEQQPAASQEGDDQP